MIHGLTFRWRSVFSCVDPSFRVSTADSIKYWFRIICKEAIAEISPKFTFKAFVKTHPPGFDILQSASSSHFCSSGFNLHIFLKLKLRASKRLIVVWEKSFPYSFPMASPTSPCVNPSLIRLCLNVLANCSNSSKSVVSSGDGSATRVATVIGGFF